MGQMRAFYMSVCSQQCPLGYLDWRSLCNFWMHWRHGQSSFQALDFTFRSSEITGVF